MANNRADFPESWSLALRVSVFSVIRLEAGSSRGGMFRQLACFVVVIDCIVCGCFVEVLSPRQGRLSWQPVEKGAGHGAGTSLHCVFVESGEPQSLIVPRKVAGTARGPSAGN